MRVVCLLEMSAEAARQTGLSESTIVVCGGGDSQLGCIGVGSIKPKPSSSIWRKFLAV